MPAAKPTSTGQVLPMPSPACSNAGCSSDQKLAATITPEAKPSSVFWMRLANLSPRNSTIAEPAIVPTKGNSNSGKISLQTINFSFFCATNIPPFCLKTIEKSKKITKFCTPPFALFPLLHKKRGCPERATSKVNRKNDYSSCERIQSDGSGLFNPFKAVFC